MNLLSVYHAGGLGLPGGYYRIPQQVGWTETIILWADMALGSYTLSLDSSLLENFRSPDRAKPC